ncbi:MAG: GGDEF domain-containing protein [Candidatus Eisenbacteria bacterium]|nr:GGDEF domain-containing protein [Candidatus Eisenbacteria bacterium]MCC7143500.1 GGDEF domain-containing protein [Candidatus Eisenbacteria bacterium]
MKPTEQTLIEQMRITEFEIAHRKELLSLSEADAKLLRGLKAIVESRVDALVDSFYEAQTRVPEVALVIGDADTLARMKHAQRRYILDLFSGQYDVEYVNHRLRVGLVHKRIGVEPKLYLGAQQMLRGLLFGLLDEMIPEAEDRQRSRDALDRLLMFDLTLMFETYLRSLVSELDNSKRKSEEYARALEDKVKERTRQLEEMTRLDALTELQNVRTLQECLTRTIRACQRRGEPLSIVYLDIDEFKAINDTHGHQHGDEVLRIIGSCMKRVSRMEDSCFRYGGDEFCLILSNCREEQAREVYMSRLSSEIKKRLMNVNISFGIVQTGPENFGEPEALIREADKRMYAAKQAVKFLSAQ